MPDLRRTISVTGLGYVGLPVAVAFGTLGHTLGFDTDDSRVRELVAGRDRLNVVDPGALAAGDVEFTSDVTDLARADFHIVTVPTPVDSANQPDLSPILRASEALGAIIKKGDIVVYESTVFPGATEEICVPILEKASGLSCGSDFSVGYSPERINPGDREHGFTSIRKVVSGFDEKTLETVAEVYSSVVSAGVYRAPSIKVTEAAKVIENTQRDLNIALMNELAMLFDRMGIDTAAVLDAAATKWNFLDFRPGLVGGHCISVDPYYLTYKAEELGYTPQVILAGRRINDGMGRFIAQRALKEMIRAGHDFLDSTVTVMGLTFKENCPDIRNSRAIDIIRELEDFGIEVQVNDPVADPTAAMDTYGVELKSLSELKSANMVIVAVAHDEYRKMQATEFRSLLDTNPVLIDVKGIIDDESARDAGIRIWRL
ncbi:MAG: nucleotide sugar dehydrogenase [Thermoleophilia bacterium]|nr:nucleotide sugar dehydrogenase [Thermoleophilia bacterium]